MIIVLQPGSRLTHASLPNMGVCCNWLRQRTPDGHLLASRAPVTTTWRHPKPGEWPTCQDCAERAAWLTEEGTAS